MPCQGLLPPAEGIVESIYQSILEPAHWRTFLQCLRRHFDCDVAAMLLRSNGSDPAAYAIWDRRFPLEELECQAIASEYPSLVHLDPLFNALKLTSDIYTLDEVASPSELANSEYYHRIIKRFDFTYQLAMHVSEPNGLECYVGVVNGAASSNFGASEKRYLRALRPDIECALKIYSQLKRDELMLAVYSAVLTHLPGGSPASADIDSDI